MKILLTGADGFTGKYFSALARAAGHDVIPLRADLTDAAALSAEIRSVQPQAVAHLAGIAFVAHAHEEAFYQVNVVGTTNLLAALVLLETAPECVLLASSANVYGNCDHSPIAETQAPAPVNHYAMSKLAVEYMARTYMDRLKIVIARPFNYTGPGQSEIFVIPKLAKHFAMRRPSITLGNLHVEREFNDVRMVCDIYAHLLEIGEPGETYNICSGEPYQLQSVIALLSKMTGHDLQIFVNQEFVRTTEVRRLCGDPTKIQSLFARHGAKFRMPSLEETLESMLASANAGK